LNFDKRYWIFIGAAILFASIASFITVYAILITKSATECNSIAVWWFNIIGMIPSMVLGLVLLVPFMITIPYVFKQNARMEPLSMLIMGCIVLYTFLDALNNITLLLGYHNIYYMAVHPIVITLNDITGTIVGTGASIC
jgi:hypothetical protein